MMNEFNEIEILFNVNGDRKKITIGCVEFDMLINQKSMKVTEEQRVYMRILNNKCCDVLRMMLYGKE